MYRSPIGTHSNYLIHSIVTICYLKRFYSSFRIGFTIIFYSGMQYPVDCVRVCNLSPKCYLLSFSPYSWCIKFNCHVIVRCSTGASTPRRDGSVVAIIFFSSNKDWMLVVVQFGRQQPIVVVIMGTVIWDRCRLRLAKRNRLALNFIWIYLSLIEIVFILKSKTTSSVTVLF